MMLSDEVLMAYADGQLDASERARLKKLIAQDPEANARLEVFQATGQDLASVFDEHMNSPLPEKLSRLALYAQPLPVKKSSSTRPVRGRPQEFRPASSSVWIGRCLGRHADRRDRRRLAPAWRRWRKRLSHERSCSGGKRWPHRCPRASQRGAGQLAEREGDNPPFRCGQGSENGSQAVVPKPCPRLLPAVRSWAGRLRKFWRHSVQFERSVEHQIAGAVRPGASVRRKDSAGRP